MKAPSLFLVFVLSKLAVLSGHPLPKSVWWPIAYFWEDAAVALVFAGMETVLRRLARAVWPTGVLYWIAAIYAAVNIPVGRALYTPLTWPMLRAARGPLADSFRVNVDWGNLALVAGTLCAAAVLPRLVRRGSLVLFAAAVFCILGPAARARVDSRGWERNVLLALRRTSFRLSPAAFRLNPAPLDQSDADLTPLRAVANDRNVVLVSLESTGAQYLGLYGGSYDLTPNLDELARNAIVFENTYAVYPESIKGLYSILCSSYPDMDSAPERYASKECHSVAEELARNGYRTALFHSGRFGYLGMESIVRDRGYQTLEDAGDIGGNHHSSFGVDEPSTVATILSWIDSLPKGQRFFLTYLPIAGHHPYETPEHGLYPETTEISRYRNAIHYGDASLGTLINGLRARGLEGNTLWVVLGDHGEAFGQHEGNYGHTFYVYEENVHVPFLISAPGETRGQTRVRKVVSLLDTAPTILDLLGLAIPNGYQGQSMLCREQRPAYFFTDYSLHIAGVRDGPYKSIRELESGRSRLFDLDHDPQERTDLSVHAK